MNICNFESYYFGFYINENADNYSYYPDNVIKINQTYGNDSFTQTFDVMIDGISYKFSYLLYIGKLHIKLYLNEPIDSIQLNEYGHVFKVFSSINYILNNFFKKSADKFNEHIINSVTIYPAQDLSKKLIDLSKRNRVYDSVIKKVIFSDNIEYRINYHDNNIEFILDKFKENGENKDILLKNL